MVSALPAQIKSACLLKKYKGAKLWLNPERQPEDLLPLPEAPHAHPMPQEEMMEARIDYLKSARGVYEAMLGLEKYLHQSGLDEKLLDLIKLRVSQINGCAYCIDMHWKDLRAFGETEQRLYGLDAWEESPYYTDQERAALAWAEAVTNIRETHAPDHLYENARKHFNEKELADLTLAIAAINSWNRLAISARSVPGLYQPAKTQEAKKTA
jgi:AhpD family alkylhydroperoxidase